MPRLAVFAAMLLAACAAPLAADPPQIVTASYIGAAGGGDLQGAAVAPDGTLYLVGNAAAPAADLPGGVKPVRFGPAAGEPRCGVGFVAHVSADGRTLLAWAEFAPGQVILTNVAVGKAGVYVGGYASEALAPALENVPGLIRKYTLDAQVKQIAADQAAGKTDPVAGRPGLGRYGAPCLVRLSPGLSQLAAGTYLEGWQQVYDKVRVCRINNQNVGNYREFFWQPTSVCPTASGDVIVAHDGGYFRLPKPSDKDLAGGDAALAEKMLFYDCCDHVSRLSADLATRTWHQEIYTPNVVPEVARQVRGGWPLPHYSNPRTHRMRMDKDESVLLAGWSASATSKEPWWSPYLWRLDGATGKPVWKVYNYDPMSGGGNRMGGQVSDTAVVSVAVEDAGTVLACLLADGGNCVMEWNPKADGSPFPVKPKGDGFGVKLVHFWGQIHRIDPKTSEGLARARIGPWAWVTDLAAMPGGGAVAVGRQNHTFKWTDDAWWTDSPLENPNGFLRVFGPDLDLEFSTNLPGVVPFELTRIGPRRYILVGRAEQAAAAVKSPLVAKPGGETDGWFVIVDLASK